MAVLLEVDDPDVAPHKREEYLSILGAIPPGRRIQAVCELHEIGKNLLAAGIQELYPGISDREVTAKIAWLWFPDDLWEKAYGPDSRYMTKEQS
jgi:hypothetical protein